LEIDMNEQEIAKTVSVELVIPEAGLPSDPQALGRLYSQAIEAQKLIDNIKNHVKETLIEGGAVAGYFLKEGVERVASVNPGKAYELLKTHVGMTPEEFLKCVKVSLPSLEKVYHAKTGKKASAEASKQDCRALLSGTFKTTKSAPSVRAVEGDNWL
jgi:hypothetical protein